MVTQPIPPPPMLVPSRNRRQPTNQHMIQPPPTLIARERPTRTPRPVPPQGPERIAPPEVPHERPLRPVPARASLRPQPAVRVVGEREQRPVRQFPPRRVQVATQ